MASDDGDSGAFLTGLDLDVVPIREKVKDERLAQVRKDHKKLMDIVGQFGNKVGGMIDKQRYEFMNAYEQHIQDVQNELQNLREKVKEISGEETRKAKLKSLDADQTKLKAEALRLDQESVSLRKQMRKLVNVLHSVENDRNWTYKRLESAKEEYLGTRREQSDLKESLHKTSGGLANQMNGSGVGFEDAQDQGDNVSLGSGVISNTSSQMTVQFAEEMRKHVDAKKMVDETYKVSRDQALLVALPRIIGSASSTELEQRGVRAQSGAVPVGPAAIHNQQTAKVGRRNPAEKRALAELVAMRARQEEIRDFVAQCSSSCDKGPWARIDRDPVEVLLERCREVVEAGDEADEDKRNELALQLVTIPEVYFIISDMLIGAERKVESPSLNNFLFASEGILQSGNESTESRNGMQMTAPNTAAAMAMEGSIGGHTPAVTPGGGGGSLLGDVSDEEIGSKEMLGDDLLQYFRKGKEDALEQALLDQEAQEMENDYAID